MAAGMAADTGHSLPSQAIGEKVAGLLKAGYPLSEEQIAAIRSVTSSEGRVAIIEGAAGSGKTTTLRPIADLYREHGQNIIATAVAWRTAVALGNDVDARPFCVDKLLRLAARGGIEINKDTTIIVDEAGMLSTRQAHHILQLSERHGAKIVFAGDTQQQQPIEAGPGPEAGPRCGWQCPGGPHTAPEGGPGGYPDPRPGRDTRDSTAPGEFDGR